MDIKLHIYRDEERILAVHANDDSEYSAIYIVEEDEVRVGSNLSDINDEVWPLMTWLKALTDLLVMDWDAVELHRVDEVPTTVREQYLAWVELGRS